MSTLSFSLHSWKSKHFRNLWLSILFFVCVFMFICKWVAKTEEIGERRNDVEDFNESGKLATNSGSFEGEFNPCMMFSMKILIFAWYSYSYWSSHILVVFQLRESESVPPCHIIGQMQAWTFRVQVPTSKDVFGHSPWNSVLMTGVHCAFMPQKQKVQNRRYRK